MPSTMFDVKVDRKDTTPLHDRVAAEIRRAIAEGEAGPGEQLEGGQRHGVFQFEVGRNRL